MLKKLMLVLALFLLTSSGAFAKTYPACYHGYGSTDPLYNGTNGDKWTTDGWCVDGYGVLQPNTIMVSSSTQPVTQGGMAVPVIVVTTGASAQSTFDALLPQQTGSYIEDTGGYTTSGVSSWGGQPAITSMATLDTLAGRGGHYVLPRAQPGMMYTIASASRSTITVDTMTPALYWAFGYSASSTTNLATADGFNMITADTIEWAPAGTGMKSGQSIQSSGYAGDTVTLWCPQQGMWQISSMLGATGSPATADALWTVISTQ